MNALTKFWEFVAEHGATAIAGCTVMWVVGGTLMRTSGRPFSLGGFLGTLFVTFGILADRHVWESRENFATTLSVCIAFNCVAFFVCRFFWRLENRRRQRWLAERHRPAA